jgi:hypothetical protein
MRTVWLTLFCLIGLATTVLVKIISPYVSADVSPVAPFAKAEVSLEVSSTNTVALSSVIATAGTMINDPPLKADQLEVSYTNEASPEVKSVKSVSIVLPKTEPAQVSKKRETIVSRHWHDPSDKRSVPSKRKASNLHQVSARTKVLIRGKGAPIRL